MVAAAVATASLASSAATSRAVGIDERQLQAAIAEAKRRYPAARGTVDLRIRLSPGGMVLDVDFLSAITPALAAALKSALVGKPLAPPNSDSIGALPSERIVQGVLIG